MPQNARHALRRSRTAALLPAVLIVSAGSAFAGMAGLPAAAAGHGRSDALAAPAAAGHGRSDALAAPAPTASRAPSPVALDAADAAALAEQRRQERASRDRRPVPAPATVAPAPPAAAPAPPPAPPAPQFVRPGTGRLTSGYGARWGRLHAGIDLAAGVGAPISAVAAGTVAAAGSEGGYGNVVRLQHDDGTVTLYAHMSAVLVRVGQRVKAGNHVGREGSTGHSTGPHLHFEVRVGGVPVDPAPWLRARGVDPAAR